MRASILIAGLLSQAAWASPTSKCSSKTSTTSSISSSATSKSSAGNIPSASSAPGAVNPPSVGSSFGGITLPKIPSNPITHAAVSSGKLAGATPLTASTCKISNCAWSCKYLDPNTLYPSASTWKNLSMDTWLPGYILGHGLNLATRDKTNPENTFVYQFAKSLGMNVNPNDQGGVALTSCADATNWVKCLPDISALVNQCAAGSGWDNPSMDQIKGYFAFLALAAYSHYLSNLQSLLLTVDTQVTASIPDAASKYWPSDAVPDGSVSSALWTIAIAFMGFIPVVGDYAPVGATVLQTLIGLSGTTEPPQDQFTSFSQLSQTWASIERSLQSTIQSGFNALLVNPLGPNGIVAMMKNGALSGQMRVFDPTSVRDDLTFVIKTRIAVTAMQAQNVAFFGGDYGPNCGVQQRWIADSSHRFGPHFGPQGSYCGGSGGTTLLFSMSSFFPEECADDAGSMQQWAVQNFDSTPTPFGTKPANGDPWNRDFLYGRAWQCSVSAKQWAPFTNWQPYTQFGAGPSATTGSVLGAAKYNTVTDMINDPCLVDVPMANWNGQLGNWYRANNAKADVNSKPISGRNSHAGLDALSFSSWCGIQFGFWDYACTASISRPGATIACKTDFIADRDDTCEKL